MKAKLLIFLLFINSAVIFGQTTEPETILKKNNITDITLAASGDKVKNCTHDGIPLYGKVKFVTSFPDFKVKYVTSFPDLKVQFVNSFPSSCGKWQIVESFPDFTVQIVESFPDFTIQVVESFPGMP